MKNKRSITPPDCCGFCEHFRFEDEEENNFCALIDPEDDAKYDANFFDVCDEFKREAGEVALTCAACGKETNSLKPFCSECER